MSLNKKSGFIFLSILIVISAIIFVYIKNIGTGSEPKWDPKTYIKVNANDMTFSVNVRGNKSGTPVILLHGFPESAVMWDKLMDDLASQGYYAIAPNQRGYSSGARPTDISAYELDPLASDVMQIANQLGLEKFHLIGHDWGAAVGWKLAADHPKQVLSYFAMSVPHIDAFGVAYREDQDQYDASDYIRFFQKSTIPEYVLAKNNYENLKGVWNQHEQSEIDHYLRIFSQENALSGALNWYRANFPAFDVGLNIGKITIPTTFIWGKNDEALKRSGVDGTHDLVTGPYNFIEIDTGHWIIQENYQDTQKHVLEHLNKYRSL